MLEFMTGSTETTQRPRVAGTSWQSPIWLAHLKHFFCGCKGELRFPWPFRPQENVSRMMNPLYSSRRDVPGGWAWNRFCLLVILIMIFVPCGQTLRAQITNGVGLKVLGARPPDVPPVPGQPLETRPPIGVGQHPAFSGQTRAVAVITRTAYKETVIASHIFHPWGLAFLPDGKIIVNEKSGAMRLIDRKTGRFGPDILGVPPVLFLGDAGLLDIVIDPNFASNRLLYFTYVQARGRVYTDRKVPYPQQDSGVVVARARLTPNDARLQNVTTLLRIGPSVPQTAHYGSRLLFGKDGYLYVSLGERFFYPTRGEAQSLFSYMGKILRITTDGKPAPGNPFAFNQDQEDSTYAEIWSYGHRNPEGLALNPVTGDIWDSEHGPQGGDEVNRIQRGVNYGWPLISYGRNYDGTKIDGTLETEDGLHETLNKGQKPSVGGVTAMPGMEQPVYYWDPVIAPSGMTFYDGKLIPEWNSNLFVAGLAGQHVARLIMAGNRVVGEERLLLDQHQRMRDVKEGPDGALWVITDDDDGRLIRIAPR